MTVIGTLISERYRLEEKIGSGGMSSVYRAFDPTLERWVAIKLMHRDISNDPDQLERFRREARAVAQLNHPHVVTVIDAGEDDGAPYIVFEYVEGETLKERIRRLGRLPIDEAIAYAIEIGRALECAHTHKLVHRDVKPQNVLIDPDGRAKVTDFGIARSLESKGLTATGRVLGTTDYVSPEQAMGQEVDERSDVYSLGVVLYEMLSGDVPYHAETQVGVAMKHVNEEMPDVYELRPDLSAAVASVVDRATAKDPHERYGSVDEMVRDLEATLEVEAARGGGTTGEATTVLRSVRRPRRLRPSRMSAAGIAMGIVGLALIGAAVWLGSEEFDGDGEAGGSSQSRVRLADATAFDPEGDGDEHSDEAAYAVDGNPTGTAWPTETYLGALGKAGVGIYVEAEKPVEATELELRLAEGGADVEIYAAPGATDAPEDLDDWRLIGDESDIGARETIALAPPSPSSLYLVWFTNLPPAEDGEGGLRAEVSDIRLVE